MQNGHMAEESKNLRDTNLNLSPDVKDNKITISYTKFRKLVTALFMVTDMIENEEPLRKKLRTLGVEIISDINSIPIQAGRKITEVMSFLDIALAINLVSEMNYNILTKEFFKLSESIKEYGRVRSVWLEEFLPNTSEEESQTTKGHLNYTKTFIKDNPLSRTSQTRTRIGVQKGSTLMNALKGVKVPQTNQDYNTLKKSRREEIVRILETSEVGLTIKDIKTKAQGLPGKFVSLVSCGEKTLQRELVSMMKDGVLEKVGEKRWSRYSVSRSLPSS